MHHGLNKQYVRPIYCHLLWNRHTPKIQLGLIPLIVGRYLEIVTKPVLDSIWILSLSNPTRILYSIYSICWDLFKWIIFQFQVKKSKRERKNVNRFCRKRGFYFSFNILWNNHILVGSRTSLSFSSDDDDESLTTFSVEFVIFCWFGICIDVDGSLELDSFSMPSGLSVSVRRILLSIDPLWITSSTFSFRSLNCIFDFE